MSGATVDETGTNPPMFRATCACGWRHDLSTPAYHVALGAAEAHECDHQATRESLFVRSEWINGEPFLSADDLALYLHEAARRARGEGDLIGARAIDAIEHNLCDGVRRAATLDGF